MTDGGPVSAVRSTGDPTGFFFASLSSLVVNALIGATLLVDGFGRDPRWTTDP